MNNQSRKHPMMLIPGYLISILKLKNMSSSELNLYMRELWDQALNWRLIVTFGSNILILFKTN